MLFIFLFEAKILIKAEIANEIFGKEYGKENKGITQYNWISNVFFSNVKTYSIMNF